MMTTWIASSPHSYFDKSYQNAHFEAKGKQLSKRIVCLLLSDVSFCYFSMQVKA